MKFPENMVQIDPELYGGIDELTTFTESRYPLVIVLVYIGNSISD